jgi:hypothetical protein
MSEVVYENGFNTLIVTLGVFHSCSHVVSPSVYGHVPWIASQVHWLVAIFNSQEEIFFSYQFSVSLFLLIACIVIKHGCDNPICDLQNV